MLGHNRPVALLSDRITLHSSLAELLFLGDLGRCLLAIGSIGLGGQRHDATKQAGQGSQNG